jgi:AraC-like DNA-binding protein
MSHLKLSDRPEYKDFSCAAMSVSHNFSERNCHGGEKGSVSVYFVRAAADALRSRGIAVAPLLVAAGIAPALLDTPDARVRSDSFSRLSASIAAALDDELFGQDSRRLKVGSFAMLAHALIACGTLRDVLICMARYFNLLLDDFHCGLEEQGKQARLTIRLTARDGRPRVFGFETLLMMQHGLACWLVGRRIPVTAASFCYPEPPNRAEYQAMYSEQLLFGQEATALCFDSALLALPVIRRADAVAAFLEHAPGNLVLKYKNADGMAARVRSRLRAMGTGKWPDLKRLSTSLHMTPATLRRRLDDEGTSYQSIKDQLRCDMAVELLCHSSRSVADIAGMVGFAEPSAFQRAFKKWTGVRPGLYRSAQCSATCGGAPSPGLRHIQVAQAYSLAAIVRGVRARPGCCRALQDRVTGVADAASLNQVPAPRS